MLYGGDRLLNFPKKAVVGQIMPKEAFYKRLNLTSEVRQKFVSDIKHIILEYKLSSDTLNVDSGKELSEILILTIDLKRQDVDYRIVENIARQNTHQLLFLLKFEGQAQLALYYNKLFKTEWKACADIKLETRGINLDSIWEGFIEQVAIQEEIIKETAISVSDKIKKQEVILKLQNEIQRLERLSRNEKQPRKKFELFSKLQELKRKLALEKGE